MATADVCRKHGVSGATFYTWKAKYGGLEVARELDAIICWRGHNLLAALLRDVLRAN